MPLIPRKSRTTKYVRKGNKGKRVTMSTVRQVAKQTFNRSTETKKHSYEVVERSINTLTTPTVEDRILQLQTGAGNSTRIGHKVTSVGIDIRGHVQHSGNSGTIYTRIFVIRKKNMAANPLVDLLERNGGNEAPQGDMETMWRRVNTDSYQVLASRTLKVGGSSNDGADAKMFKMWIPYKGTLTYEGTGQGPPKYNEISVIVYSARSDNDTAGSSAVELSFNSTFYYKDA